MSDLPAPAPHPNLETQPYFDAAAEGRLSLPRCDDCAFVIWYPRTRCPECGSDSVSWVDSPGTGTVYSFSVTRRGQGRWRAAAPYVLAYVELDEGPRILTNVVGCDPDEVHIDMAVRAVFDETEDGPPLLRFTATS